MLALAGCGGLDADRNPGRESQHEVAGLGLGLELPPGWTARILIGAEGRPVLHAASFPLSPNDDDMGEVARETIGSRGQMYVNVRDLGPGESSSSPPGRVSALRLRATTSWSRQPLLLHHGRDPRRRRLRSCVPRLRHLGLGRAASSHRRRRGERCPFDTLAQAVRAQAGDTGARRRAPRRLRDRSGPVPRLGRPELLRGCGGGELRPLACRRCERTDLRRSERRRDQAPRKRRKRRSVHHRPAPTRARSDGVRSARLRLQRSGPGADRPLLRRERKGVRPLGLRRLSAAEPDGPRRGERGFRHASDQAGRLLPGRGPAGTFAASTDWYTGTSGPAQIEPDGEQTTSSASTVPYRDPPNQFPPHATLAALPPDGIAIVAWLSRNAGSRSELPDRKPPFKIAQAQNGSFEGVPSDRATYQLLAHVPGRFDVTLWIFFGRPHPADEQIDRAQAELDRLRLPNR